MKARVALTVLALCGLAAHQVWPSFKVDPVSLVLVLIAALPWLNSAIKSLEIPGVLKIELPDAQEATRKLVESPTVKTASACLQSQSSLTGAGEVIDSTARTVARVSQVGAADPNLAVVAAGIETEKAVRELAVQVGLEGSARPVNHLLLQLEMAGVIQHDMASGLRDLIALRNRAAHGAEVSPGAAKWVVAVLGPTLQALSELVREKTRSE